MGVIGARHSGRFGICIRIQKGNTDQLPNPTRMVGHFLRAAEIRMGYATKANRSLTTATIVRLLEIIRREAEKEGQIVAREYYKVGAAVATAVCASLRGPEVFQLDLAGMRSHIHMGRTGIMPDKPLKVGVNLTTAPQSWWCCWGTSRERRESTTTWCCWLAPQCLASPYDGGWRSCSKCDETKAAPVGLCLVVQMAQCLLYTSTMGYYTTSLS
jgi:hypothetical protein